MIDSAFLSLGIPYLLDSFWLNNSRFSLVKSQLSLSLKSEKHPIGATANKDYDIAIKSLCLLFSHPNIQYLLMNGFKSCRSHSNPLKSQEPLKFISIPKNMLNISLFFCQHVVDFPFVCSKKSPCSPHPQQEATYPFDAFPPYARGLVRALSMDVVHGLETLSREGATETGNLMFGEFVVVPS